MQTAAFFRVEGILLSRGALSLAAYFGINALGLRERFIRFGAVMLASPAIKLISQSDAGLATRMAYLATRDMTEDRLEVLSDEYCEVFVKDRTADRGRELIKQARKAGHRIVLLSEAIEPVARRLAEELGDFDHLQCNKLEIRKGRATGKLEAPIIGGHETARWLKDYAASESIDLAHSCCYASMGGDLAALMTVGEPCAANPDHALRRAARELGWPIVDYDA